MAAIPISYVITELDVGGAERCLYELARRLDRARFLPRVIALAGEGEVGQWLQREGIDVTYLGARRAADLWVYRRLVRALREQQPTLVHSFLFHANLLARFAARRIRVPHVVSSVRVAERRYRWHLWLDRWTIGKVDVEVCVSDDVQRFTRDVAGIPADKLTVIPNGVDADRFAQAAPVDWTQFGLPAEARVLLFVGRYEEQKGVEYLRDAFRRLAERHPDLHLVMLGAVPAGVDPLALAEHHAHRVHHLGWRPNIENFLRAATVFVQASLWEGMPNVVAEACAAGCPIMATDVEGTRTLVQHGETGLLVPAGDPARLAQAIEQVLDQPATADRCAEAAQRRVREQFTLNAMSTAYERLYQRLVNRRETR